MYGKHSALDLVQGQNGDSVTDPPWAAAAGGSRASGEGTGWDITEKLI